MPLTPEQIKAEREKYGITVPNKRVAEFDALLNISKSEPTLGTPDRQSGIDTPNLGENTATEMEAGGQKIVDSVSRAADKFNQAGDIFGENGGRALAGKVGALTEGAAERYRLSSPLSPPPLRQSQTRYRTPRRYRT